MVGGSRRYSSASTVKMPSITPAATSKYRAQQVAHRA